MKLLRTRPPLGGTGPDKTRIFPNGEVVVFRQRTRSMRPLTLRDRPKKEAPAPEVLRLFLMMEADYLHRDKPGWYWASLFMGLSLVRNFDIAANPNIPCASDLSEQRALEAKLIRGDQTSEIRPPGTRKRRNGSKGIPRRAARTVRCACHLLQKTYGRGRLTFATVTVPNVPIEQLRLIHESWNKITEMYRLGLRRDLQAQGLRGEIVSVSEIQGKRHKKTGVPVLHIHSVFVGRLPYGGWAISTERHDELWRRAIQNVTGKLRCNFASAANLQEVRTSASAYLGKYMTKSGPEIKLAVDDGFTEWLPRQWWNCSRSLIRWVEAETVEGTEVSGVLMDAARVEDKSVWEFYGEIGIDIGWSQNYWLASYGRLNNKVAQELREILGWKEQRRPERKGLAFVA